MTGPGITWQQGAVFLDDGRCRFRVWAPRAGRVALRLLDPHERLIPMEPGEHGYFEACLDGVRPGARYFYRIGGTGGGGAADSKAGSVSAFEGGPADGSSAGSKGGSTCDSKDRPDPSSRLQPEGVHGPSQVVDSRFEWEDRDWTGLPLEQYILYELHVGAFTPEGTFDAVIPQLDALRELGITVVELMPVAQFPGSRNWGYDGVFPFAAQFSYGGPAGLRRLVNACHQRGLGVALDVVYNHLGPEGNYLAEFAPYFTDRYKTPWGPAVNFDGPDSDEVRRFFIENALYWITELHVDALRLDAIHAIFDQSAYPFLEELGDAVHQQAKRLGREICVIPESALNDTRVIRSKPLGGFALDAQWNDDFHHSLHTWITGDRGGYYCDFGEFNQLVKAYREGFVYSGEYSRFRRRRHGNSSSAIPARQLVVFSQNHDHVGNRMLGERLCHLVSFENLKLAAGLVLLSPFLPLLFMGEEYAETAPFLYFVSHGDPALVEAVRRGRKEEFASFAWQGEPPDPQAEETFLRSKLNLSLRREAQHQAGHRQDLQRQTRQPLEHRAPQHQASQHQVLFDFYRELIRLRKSVPALALLSKDQMEVTGIESQAMLLVRRWCGQEEVFYAFSLADAPVVVNPPPTPGPWRKLLDSAEPRWLGSGSQLPERLDSTTVDPATAATTLCLAPKAMVLYVREHEPAEHEPASRKQRAQANRRRADSRERGPQERDERE